MESTKISYPVTNFPPWYPWHKIWWSNITYWFSQIPLWPRNNSLSRADIRKMRYLLQDGDIILWGNFHHMSGVFIAWVVTHAITYIGKWRCIHAFAHGVWFISLRKIWRTYDTIIILRPYWQSQKQRKSFRETIITKIGKPYDFFFWLEKTPEEAYFCTELINESLRKNQYETLLDSVKNSEDIIDRILDSTFRAHRVLSPEGMIYGNFEVIFHSENIQKDQHNSYSLKEKNSQNSRIIH